jgi:hypothetical protein
MEVSWLWLAGAAAALIAGGLCCSVCRRRSRDASDAIGAYLIGEQIAHHGHHGSGPSDWGDSGTPAGLPEAQPFT